MDNKNKKWKWKIKTTYNLPPKHNCHIKEVNKFRCGYVFSPLGHSVLPQAVNMSLSWVSKWEFGEGEHVVLPITHTDVSFSLSSLFIICCPPLRLICCWRVFILLILDVLLYLHSCKEHAYCNVILVYFGQVPVYLLVGLCVYLSSLSSLTLFFAVIW